jgi:hypothetical protein
MSIVPYRREWMELREPANELAKILANTEFVPKALRGNPPAIAACILYGDEVGLGPMQSLAKIAVIDGKPALMAEAQRALILAAGHDFWVEEASTTRVTVAGRRQDSEQTSRVTWTMDDAKRANLSGKLNWRTYPRQMLLARASAELARAVFADAIGGLAAVEELEDQIDLDGNPKEDGEPKTQTRRRQRQGARATLTTVEPPKPAEPEQPLLPDELAAVVDPDEDREIARLEAEAALEDELAEIGAERMISDPQRRKLHALFNERGVENREPRLAYCSTVVGRTIETSNELTLDEASKVIDALEQWDPQDPDSQPFPDGI